MNATWRAVADELPDYETPVLGYCNGTYLVCEYSDSHVEDIPDSWEVPENFHGCEPTHWMPLPPAPGLE